MFADDIALVDFKDNWEKLKQTVEINLWYMYGWMKNKSIITLHK
jgi:hypothetical protein